MKRATGQVDIQGKPSKTPKVHDKTIKNNQKQVHSTTSTDFCQYMCKQKRVKALKTLQTQSKSDETNVPSTKCNVRKHLRLNRLPHRCQLQPDISP